MMNEMEKVSVDPFNFTNYDTLPDSVELQNNGHSGM